MDKASPKLLALLSPKASLALPDIPEYVPLTGTIQKSKGLAAHSRRESSLNPLAL